MYQPMQHSTIGRSAGVTLVELMITIAVIAVITTIALPAYNNYIREGHFATMRATINGLRTVIEDYHLENGDFGTEVDLDTFDLIDGRFGWNPGGDLGAYDYTVSVTGTNSYDVWGEYGSDVFVRCEDRYRTCCDSETSGSSTASGSCSGS